MLDELHHECGIAGLYLLNRPKRKSPRSSGSGDVASLIPPLLLDIQNRGQLAAGLTSYDPRRQHILQTYKDVGTVAEVFRMSHPAKHRAIIDKHRGIAAIAHTRYATCGAEDVRHAQPFERIHGRLWKWFSFAFNGQLANYRELRDRLLSKRGYHFALDTDTEMIMHALAYRLRGDKAADLRKVMASMSRALDGAYNIAFLDATGRMFVARDPLGFRPLCWGVKDGLFAAASESVALENMGITDIKEVAPGEMILIENGRIRSERFAKSRRSAHCFFEWVYFANVASTIAGTSVYVARSNAGRSLAALETETMDASCIVVPVPDTAKAAADAFAYEMGIPCVEGLIRNRYVGRAFSEPTSTRGRAAQSKYTPQPPVLRDKRVFLVEDSIVRSTTLRALVDELRTRGHAKEVHVRVGCPAIVAPCFYGIDMSTLGELFAPRFASRCHNGNIPPKTLRRMANALHLDSLKYLPLSDLVSCLETQQQHLCTGCVTCKFPTPWGNKLMQRARRLSRKPKSGRTYE